MDFSDILTTYIIMRERYCTQNCDKCKFSTDRPNEDTVCLLDELRDTWHLPSYDTHKVIRSARYYLTANCEGECGPECKESKCWLYSYDLDCCLADLFDEDSDNQITFHI